MDCRARAHLLVERDLRRVGLHLGSLSRRARPRTLSKQDVRRAMADHRIQVMLQSADWISRVEPWVLSNLAEGSDIVPARIRPSLVWCTTASDHVLFRYCRFLSSFPYSKLVGRQMRFLIRDTGHPGAPLMAIAALASPVIQIRCRDEWIGWYGPAFRHVRSQRLKAIMDLSVAIALPPYNHLLAGKLVCYAAASNEIREEYQDRYSDSRGTSLALITASSIYGKHSSQYNRVTYGGRRVFRLAGETEGFGTVHIAPDTFLALRELVEFEREPLGYELKDGYNWKLRVIRDGLRILGFDADAALQHGFRRGIFVAPLASNACEYLRAETDELMHFDWPLKALLEHWRARWLRMRSENPIIMDRVRSFRKGSVRLTKALP
jgi:hypothetical protein